MAWEYKTIKVKTDWAFIAGRSVDGDEMNSHLNRLGRDGWELTSAFDINAHHGESREVVLIFKRPS